MKCQKLLSGKNKKKILSICRLLNLTRVLKGKTAIKQHSKEILCFLNYTDHI